MTEQPDDHVEPPREGGRRRKRRSIPGCLAVLVALAVVVGGFYFVVSQGVDAIKDRFFENAADYDGPGRGKVTFEVVSGDVAAEICRNLKAEKVVASVDACLEAATANPDTNKIQAGFYPMKKEMQAADAIEILVDPANQVRNTVTVPEGLRVVDIVEILADKTDYTARQYQRVLDDPGQLGLPDYAEGNPEGYLFPATYEVGPKDRPVDILTAMVDRWEQAAEQAGLEEAAAELGYTPAELMIVASLVESEASRAEDRAKVARVIFNRLEGEETNGLLQIDATVNYAADQELGAVPTTEDLEIDSPYNTYKYPGLPPTPIEAPGDAAIEAAANPAEGGWYYYVTVNLRTGETKFAETYDEFLGYKEELRDYCETESEGAC
jgi:UPF0755 protein